MTFADRLAFDPAVPWGIWTALAVLAGLTFIFYLGRGGRAPVSRALGLALILAGLASPMIVRETREPAADIAAVIVDTSESLDLADRDEAVRKAAESMRQALGKETNLEVRVREAPGGPDGTALVAALEDALADAPKDRIAGAILITDGQVSDAPADPAKLRAFGPVQTLVVGDPSRGDRRLELVSTPAFGIVGETLDIEARVIDPVENSSANVRVLIDGAPVRSAVVRTGEKFTLQVRTPKRGANLVVVEADAGPQEISLVNNRAAFELAGVRDRLRVLLVTGEPHPGARVWRNLLKSDPAVDLVHFTILRPPEKQDLTPLDELALIAFPTYELFVDKLDQFDLIIFDRYQRRGILPLAYFDNIARRVEDGGALLVVAGAEDAGPDSLHRTPLAAILPSSPTGEVLEGAPFRPAPTSLGLKHPVTRGLPDPSRWGRWTRYVQADALDAGGAQSILGGPGGRPLLVLQRAGRGRVAQLWSDQVWLWARGYDGGGPHGELLRRLAHWLMQEPELEDERLTVRATREGLVVERSTLGQAPGAAEIIAPDGTRSTAALTEAAPGLWRTTIKDPKNGIYETRLGGLRAFAAVGPLNPKEAAALQAEPALLKPLSQATGGTVKVLGEKAESLPAVRRVAGGERAYGDDWIGLRARGGYVVRASAAEPLGPGWLWATLGLALLMFGWRREAG